MERTPAYNSSTSSTHAESLESYASATIRTGVQGALLGAQSLEPRNPSLILGAPVRYLSVRESWARAWSFARALRGRELAMGAIVARAYPCAAYRAARLARTADALKGYALRRLELDAERVLRERERPVDTCGGVRARVRIRARRAGILPTMDNARGF